MANTSKVVYLFGAGATHAEFMNLYPGKITDGNFLTKNSLLMADVSKRVCEGAKNNGSFPKKIAGLISPAGLSNIELFISLIENNEVRSEATIEKLKSLMKKDILDRLTKARLKKFYLHKALLEIHQHNNNEELLGVISLNYDRVLDDAYKSTRNTPNYCLHSDDHSGVPLLKLHGAFALEYRGHKLPIITPGINKNYLELPYNFIWGRALELLIDCDILRVIGCSLSQNDVGLVDLLFKAHLARKDPFELQVIAFDPKGNKIKEHLGFLPKIKTALEIEGGIIGDQTIADHSTGANPFRIWLKAKIEKLRSEKILTDTEIRKSSFIKSVLK